MFFCTLLLLSLIDLALSAHRGPFCPEVTQWTQWWNGNQWIECKFIDNNTWTIIQSRSLGRDNSISFDQNWSEYIVGFGSNRSPVVTYNISFEYWIGLQQIFEMTKQGTKLRIELSFPIKFLCKSRHKFICKKT